jgi:hypothetical protein
MELMAFVRACIIVGLDLIALHDVSVLDLSYARHPT